MKKLCMFFLCFYSLSLQGMATGDVNLLPFPEDGDPDVEFGAFNFNAGTITTDFGFFSSSNANAIYIQNDGNILTSGSSFNSSQTGPNSFALARFSPNGVLDRTFSQSGTLLFPGQVITNFGGTDDQSTCLNVQPNTIIVAGGFTNVNQNYQFALAFYQKDGSYVSTIGSDGLVITPSFSTNSNDIARAMVLQDDGRIILAGTTIDALSQAFFALARYNPDGTLDTTFGTGGQVILPSFSTGSQDRAFAVALDQLNRIVVGGITTDATGTTGFALARLTTTGALDVTFNPLGTIPGTLSLFFDGSNNILRALLIQPDGAIIAGGTTNQNGIGTDFALARFLDDGSLDPTFNEVGTLVIALTNTENILTSMALQADGKILACGSNGIEGVDQKFLVARFTPSGTLDTVSFNPPTLSNPVFVPVPDLTNPFIIPDFNILPQIDVNNFSTSPGFPIAPNFDGGNPAVIDGFVLTPIFGTNDHINAVALQPDSRIVVAGGTKPLLSNGSLFGLARYINNNPLTPVTITDPTNGAIVFTTGLSGPAFMGTAPNPSNIALFYSGPTGVLLGTTTTIPGLDAWIISGVTGLAEGDNQVQAVANYRDGQMSMISDTIIVTREVETI
ncbi:MAG: hypothetical protein ACOYT8_04325 [Candidatus Dependentiae bacterium]